MCKVLLLSHNMNKNWFGIHPVIFVLIIIFFSTEFKNAQAYTDEKIVKYQRNPIGIAKIPIIKIPRCKIMPKVFGSFAPVNA